VGQKIAVVVLAAGASRRLGQPKQRLPYRGVTLLRHVVAQALEAGLGPVVVVLGAWAKEVAHDLEGLPVHIAINPQWPEGMASSLRCGVRKVQKGFPEASALMVVLGDQPLVSSPLLRRLAEAYLESSALVGACQYGGTLGPPAIFDRRLWPELLALKGDVGAKSVIKAHPYEIVIIPFPEGGVDIDSPGDWASFLGRLAHGQGPG